METNLQLHGGDRKNIYILNCTINCLDMHAYLYLDAHLVIHVTLFYWDLFFGTFSLSAAKGVF